MKKVLFFAIFLFVIASSGIFYGYDIFSYHAHKIEPVLQKKENPVSHTAPTVSAPLPVVWASTAPAIEEEDEVVVLPPPPPTAKPPTPPPIKVATATKKMVVRDPPPAGETIPSSNGKRMCPKKLKDDHPSKSKRNKKGHMDMECCPDPDEIPNNNCDYSQYSVERNGKWIIPFLQVSNL